MIQFFYVCQNGHILVVKLLLNDPRVDVDLQDKYGFNALFMVRRAALIREKNPFYTKKKF